MMVSRTNNISSTMMASSLIYTDTYNISQLGTDDEGREYQCEVVINTSLPVMANGSITLDVMGEFTILSIFSFQYYNFS